MYHITDIEIGEDKHVSLCPLTAQDILGGTRVHTCVTINVCVSHWKGSDVQQINVKLHTYSLSPQGVYIIAPLLWDIN